MSIIISVNNYYRHQMKTVSIHINKKKLCVNELKESRLTLIKK